MVRVFRNGALVLVPRAEIEEQEKREALRIAGGDHANPQALYGCEGADLATMTSLAKLAGTTIADLQRRRHAKSDIDPECPDTLPEGRRRCWDCPVWERLQITPF